MCGIVGFTGKKNPELLKSMMNSIVHRGPDGEGKYEDELFSIGMRRLAIIDPQKGWQPIWNEKKTLGIVFNGEIYNYKILWKELESKGHKFSTDHSDTEVVLHGFEEWGAEVLNKLQGMFAFCIFNKNTKKLFIARDRLGIKPLYYSVSAKGFVFASEIKPILQYQNSSGANRDVLYQYLIYRVHDHGEETFFKGIMRLKPGHYLEFDAKDGKIINNKKYWEPAVSAEFSSSKKDHEYAEELKAMLFDTVESHLMTDVPLGVTLSGGLDSSGVVAITDKLMRKDQADLHTRNLLTFSAVYPNESIDESEYINLVADHFHTEKHFAYPKMNEFWLEIEKWIGTQEEPTISSAPYAIYSVMREAQKYVKVILSGQGGDELFAGYIPYFTSYLSSARKSKKLWAVLRESIKGFDMYFPYFKQMLRSRLAGGKNVFMKEFLNTEFSKGQTFEFKNSANLNQRLFNDISSYSVPNVLRYEDKNAMAFSIETRVPFLDHKLVEYVLSLPIDQKIKFGWNRYIYRNAMKGILPESIRLRRKKIGFTTPENKWMKAGKLKILQVFNSKEFKTRGIFDANKVIKYYNLWLENKVNIDAMVFWRILNTELWLRYYNL